MKQPSEKSPISASKPSFKKKTTSLFEAEKKSTSPPPSSKPPDSQKEGDDLVGAVDEIPGIENTSFKNAGALDKLNPVGTVEPFAVDQ